MHAGFYAEIFFDDTPPLQDLIRVDICKSKRTYPENLSNL